MNDRGVDLEVTWPAGLESQVLSLHLEERVSAPVSAELLVAAPHDLAREELLAQSLSVALILDGAEARRWDLVIGSIEYEGAELGALRFRLGLHAPLWLLSHTQSTRKFRHLSAQEILTGILTTHRVPHVFRLRTPTPQRTYRVQYAETDLAFCQRLAEHEGIHYFQDETGVLVFSDRSDASDLVADTPYRLIEAEGALAHGERGLLSISQVAEVAIGTVTVNDFDWKRPRLDLKATARAATDLDLSLYSYPAGFRDPVEGEAIARRRLEAHRARSLRIEGVSSVPAFRPGHAFRFRDEATVDLDVGAAGRASAPYAPNPDLDIGAAGRASAPYAPNPNLAFEHTLLSVTHDVTRPGHARSPGASAAPSLTYQNRFEAIPREVPYRPPLNTPRPTVAGNHTVMVRGPEGEEIHTDEHARFRAQFHWDREAKGTDSDSRWLRLVQESATSMTFARVGWEMSVAYIDGDPERPIGLARHINGEMTPTYEPPAKDGVFSIKTKTYPGGGGYNELRMNDRAGRMSIDVRAQRDYTAHVKRDHEEHVGKDDTRVCQVDSETTIGNDHTVSIARDELLQAHANHSLSVAGNRTLTVGGKEVVSAGSQSCSVTGNELEQVGTVRLTIAGKVKLPDLVQRAKDAIPSLGDIGAAALEGAGSATGLGGAVSGVAGAVSGVAGAVKDVAGKGGENEGPPDPAAAAERAKAEIGKWSQAVDDAAGAFGSALSTLREAGNLGNLVKQGLSGAVASVKDLVPTPAGVADQITGGLASDFSVEAALDQLMSGSITRTAGESCTRSVGGALVAAAAQGGLRAQHGKLFFEATGGAKITRVADDYAQSVTGPLAITTAGMVRRVARGRASCKAKDSHVHVGGPATIESHERVDIRAPSVQIEGEESLCLTGEELLRLADGEISVGGNLRLSADRIVLKGSTVDLSKK